MENENMVQELLRIQGGFDIGNTFFNNLHSETDMLAHYRHEDLRLLAPKYFIKILQEDLCRKYSVPPVDSDGMFKLMGIEMREHPYDKIVLFHTDYCYFKKEHMIYELDISIFISRFKAQ